MTRPLALLMEKKLALDLRRQGYAVWFNWIERTCHCNVGKKQI